MRPLAPLGCRGFTAVETILAVALLSLMGLLIGNTMLKTGQALGHSSDRRRGAALAAMVFEQYKAFAQISYDDLASHDQSDVAPRDFFNTHDDLGFEGMRITTLTQCVPDGSSCSVRTTISAPHGASAQSMMFEKTYLEAPLGDTAKEVSGI